MFEIWKEKWTDFIKSSYNTLVLLNEPKLECRSAFYIFFFACVWIAFGLAILTLSAVFPDYNFLYGMNPDNARYMLSALIQSLAAVVAIVVTLSLVAIQLSAQSYSSRVIDVYRKTPDIWIMTFIYATTIFFGLATIKIIGTNTLPSSGLFSLEFFIFIAYFLGFFAFICLIPYIWNTLALLNPSTVIKILAEDITEQKILEAVEKRETTLDENDPLLPIIDIITSSIMKYDHATVRSGANAIVIQTGEIINEENDKQISRHICSYLERLSILSLKREDQECSGVLLSSLAEIGKNAADNKLENATNSAVSSLSVIGVKAAKNNLKWTSHFAFKETAAIVEKTIQNKWDTTTQLLLIYLAIIGEKIAENKWKDMTEFTVITFAKIGNEAAKNNLNLPADESINILEKIGKIATKNGWEDIERKAKRKIHDIEVEKSESNQHMSA